MKKIISRTGKAIKNPGHVIKVLGENTKKFFVSSAGWFDGLGDSLYAKNLKWKAKNGFFHVPLPMLGIDASKDSAGGGETSLKKRELILKNIPSDCLTAVDIGSYNGFFALELAQRGIWVTGYEPEPELLSVCHFLVRRLNLDNAAFFGAGINKDNVRFIPEADVALVLSVFHDWVWQGDYASALEILRTIWSKTRKVMFFELPNTVENEKIARYMPSMGNNVQECEAYIQRMLEGLGAARIRLLSFWPTDFRLKERRHLFIVEKTSA